MSATITPTSALAYGWMIRHEYTSCAQCHADPSGGSLLTPYGRAQGDLLLRTRYGEAKKADTEPHPTAGFLFGLVKPPDEVSLGGDIRLLGFARATDGAAFSGRFVPMQLDLVGQVQQGRLRANVSLGITAEHGALRASLTQGYIRPLSRHHWVALDLGEDNQVTVRFGRMNLPYGLRIVEHTSFVRSATQTDINDGQQHGVAVAYNSDLFRAEVMGIVGNLQLSPSEYRQRGYSGYLEFTPAPWVALGLSSLVTYASRSEAGLTSAMRQAHGVFARGSAGPVVAMVEADVLLDQSQGAAVRLGSTGALILDVEPLQGFHVGAMGEYLVPDLATASPRYGVWGTAQWFFAPHVSIRADVVRQMSVNAAGNTSILLQLGAYL